MDVTIRRGTVNDAQGVVEVINSVIREEGLTALYPEFTVEQEKAFIQHLGPRSAMFIAEADGTIVGVQTIDPFATYTQAMDHVATMGTFVQRDFRREGIGRKLMAATLSFARELKYEKIIIYVRFGNPAAQTFYRKMGFVAKMMLERQIKIKNKYDDEMLMELFIQPEEEQAAETPVAEKVQVPEPAVAVSAPVAAQVGVDPVVGAVTVRRAKRQDIKTLAAIMRGTIRWRPSPTEEEVLEMLFDKGYWLAMSRRGGGVTGWRAENLVMCIDDFYVYPPQYYPQVGEPLLETVEEEARALSCEVAIVFLEKQISKEAVQFFLSHHYERQELDSLFSVWRQVAQEFMTGNRFMMVKKLLEKRVMRPL
ncbi:MAG: GNAT family N-acetyltransferase [Anaerolineae bacterium]|nr:GNAT family N-acetyltransferase [Anaerolineae bacterium]